MRPMDDDEKSAIDFKETSRVSTLKKEKETSPEAMMKKIAELEEENDRLKSLLLIDELTGLYNKRFFYLQLEVETARTRRTGQACTLIAMDLDNFKTVNDTLGHHVGDQLIAEFAGILAQNIRPTDFACRFGGDEFFIIMPASGIAESLFVARRIQDSLKRPDFNPYTAQGKCVSVSIGLAVYVPFDSMSVEAFFQQADKNLLHAKKSGKNTIFHDIDAKMWDTAVNNAERKALSMDIQTSDETEEQ